MSLLPFALRTLECSMHHIKTAILPGGLTDDRRHCFTTEHAADFHRNPSIPRQNSLRSLSVQTCSPLLVTDVHSHSVLWPRPLFALTLPHTRLTNRITAARLFTLCLPRLNIQTPLLHTFIHLTTTYTTYATRIHTLTSLSL